MILDFFSQTNLIEKLRNIRSYRLGLLLFLDFLILSDRFKLKKNIKIILIINQQFYIGLFQILSLIPGVSRSGIQLLLQDF